MNRIGIPEARQFYDTYGQNAKLAPLVREITYSHNIVDNGATQRGTEAGTVHRSGRALVSGSGSYLGWATGEAGIGIGMEHLR